MSKLTRTRFIKQNLSALALALSSMAAHALDAPSAMVPSGLSAGDEFYVIFVTHTTRNASSSTIADYNNFVNTAADAYSTYGTDDVSITWRVVGATISNAQCDPYNSDNTTGIPMYNLVGTKIADDRDDMLDGSLDAAISVAPDGTSTIRDVWTGCNAFGTGSAQLGNGASPAFGVSNSSSIAWADTGTSDPTMTKVFYAVSPKLTVPSSTSAPASPQKW